MNSRASWHVKLLLILLIPVWGIGTGKSVAPAPEELLWWKVEPKESLVAPYEPLRRFSAGAVDVDYLMDPAPAVWRGGDEKKRAWARKRAYRGRLRFYAQYALAPALVHQVEYLPHVEQRAQEPDSYYLLWDPAFFSPLDDVVALLEPIARQRSLTLDVHEAPSGIALIVMKRL